MIGHYFGADALEPETAERFCRLLGEPERMLAAWDGDEVVGGAGAFPFELTVPGGRTTRAGGITIVGVLPTHRRRGVLTNLMRTQMDDLRSRGEHVAYLWASEGTIYERFGYGMASLQGELFLPRERTAFARPFEPVGTVRLVSHERALETFPEIYARAARPGMFARTHAWWDERVLLDIPVRRGGAGPLNRVLLEVDGRPEAYALYRVKGSWEGFASTGSVNVAEAVGATPEATASIWRFLLDMDWTSQIRADKLPVDHPLLHLLAEPRRMKLQVTDCLWVRLLDVGEALAARGYRGDGSVVLEVRDAFRPANEGRWRVGGGGVGRTDDEPELALDVAALGSVYLGGFTFRQLHEALRVEERTEGAVARADALFAADSAPWCPEIF